MRSTMIYRAMFMASAIAAAIWHKHIPDAPNRLDVPWRSGICLDQFPQARNLNIQAAVKGLKFTPPRQLRQLFT